jgi:GR25 family glycosyltransferase involved in LPS biosynthesis
MNNSTKILIISLKNSKRVIFLKKRLKEINLRYKIIDAVNGKEFHKRKRLPLIYNKNQTIKNIDRELSPPEIGTAASHIKAYKYIIKNKIQQAIIMEDDAYPSKLLNQWINNNIKVNNNEILSFYAYASGVLERRSFKKILQTNIGLHYSKTHLYNSSCYQINNYTCKKIISITRGKVVGYPDWPFSFVKDKIKFIVTIPFLAIINDRGISYLNKARNKILGKDNPIKKAIPYSFLFYFRILYYLSFLPFIFRKYKNIIFYYEHFFQKNFFYLLEIFFNNYLNMRKIYYLKNFYTKDLQDIVLKVKNYKKI